MADLPLSQNDITRVKGLGFLHNRGTRMFSARIVTVNGKITANQLMRIAEAAKMFGCGEAAFTTRLTVELPGIPFEQIEALRAFLATAGLETGGTGAKVRPVVSCKGTTCQYGLIDTFDLSRKIHERFYEGYHAVALPHKFKIAVGGCPNNCVKPDLNDLGIMGQRMPEFDATRCKGCGKCAVQTVCPMQAAVVRNGVLDIDKTRCNACGRCVGKCPWGAIPSGKTGYAVMIGGRWGKQVNRGRFLPNVFTSESEVLDVIEKTILLFREQGHKGERLASLIERLGWDDVLKRLLSNDLLERKQAILALNN